MKNAKEFIWPIIGLGAVAVSGWLLFRELKGLSLAINANNLFDKDYVAAINKSGYRYFPGTPAPIDLKRFGHFNGAIARNGTALGNVVSAEITYANGLDRIEIGGPTTGFRDLAVYNSAEGAVISWGGGTTITLVGIDRSMVDASDFIFT